MQKQTGNPLKDYFYSNQINIIHKWNHYFEIYHHHFHHFVGKECVIVEIGVSMGGSLQMWKNYFGPKARIYGVDINPFCKQFEEDQIEIIIGSQSDRAFLKALKDKIPKIDILIDDGGHTMEQQITTFEELFGHIADDGIYLCEDILTSYLPNYNGGLGKEDTFIEFTKTLIDHIHAWHIPDQTFAATEYTRSMNSIHFYDGIVVIQKKHRVQPWSEMTGKELIIMDPSIDAQFVIRFKLKLKLLGAEIPDYQDVGHLMSDTNRLLSYLGDLYEGKNWPRNGETMIGYKRLTNLEECILDVLKNNISGDFIETGVWRGGACIFMAALLDQFNIHDKKVWLADSFQGLPKPDTNQYPADKDDIHYSYEELIVSEEEVVNNFHKYSIPMSFVNILKGWFKDTLPESPVNQLAILRLDGDMYESTIDVLFYLYPKLNTGGFCIVDDWGAVTACRKAVEDYRRIMRIEEAMMTIDWTGIFWKKEKSISSINKNDFDDLLRKQ